MSYSNEQIKFILENYLDIASGSMPIDKVKEFLKSSGRKNPAETFIILSLIHISEPTRPY